MYSAPSSPSLVPPLLALPPRPPSPRLAGSAARHGALPQAARGCLMDGGVRQSRGGGRVGGSPRLHLTLPAPSRLLWVRCPGSHSSAIQPQSASSASSASISFLPLLRITLTRIFDFRSCPPYSRHATPLPSYPPTLPLTPFPFRLSAVTSTSQGRSLVKASARSGQAHHAHSSPRRPRTIEVCAVLRAHARLARTCPPGAPSPLTPLYLPLTPYPYSPPGARTQDGQGSAGRGARGDGRRP